MCHVCVLKCLCTDLNNFHLFSFLLYFEVNVEYYSTGYQELYGERTDQAFQPELNASMMYYYDDGTGVQMYSVDETLLKEYIKRQMYVDCLKYKHF